MVLVAQECSAEIDSVGVRFSSDHSLLLGQLEMAARVPSPALCTCLLVFLAMLCGSVRAPLPPRAVLVGPSASGPPIVEISPDIPTGAAGA